MNGMYRLLKILPGIFLYLAIYLFAYYLLTGNWPNLISDSALMLTLITVLLTHRRMQQFLERHSRWFLSARVSRVLRLMEHLNRELENVNSYFELKNVLMEAFDRIIENTPFVFYVKEANMFYLAHTRRIKTPMLPVAHINDIYFQVIPKGKMYKPLRQMKFPPEIEADFKRLKLEYLYMFSGHSHVFAFLAVTADVHRLLQAPSVNVMFRRVNNKTGPLLESSALHMDLQHKQFEIRKLLEVSQKILSELDIKKVLDYMLDALEELIEYDAASVFLLKENGEELLSTSSRGYASRELLSLKVGQGSCGHVVRTRTIDVIPDVRRAEHYYQARPETRSQISLPMLFEGRVLGVICVESDEPDFFRDQDVELLKIFANQGALAIHNAQQVKIRLQKRALENELFHAGTVQRGLLIKHIPHIEGMRFLAENIPSQNVSGDLYDFKRFNDHTLGCIIGDVSGKGAPAALMMSLILASFRTQSKSEKTTCDVVNRMNNLLTETTIEGKFTTLFYGIFQSDTRKLIYTNAGHNPPYIIRANGEIIKLTGGGLLLGFLKNQEYIQKEVQLEKDDLFIAFTDGLSEAMNDQEEEFGEARILDLLQRHKHRPLHDIKKALLEAVTGFSGSTVQADDITLIIGRMES
ncbi:MAG: GAF domain-containing protein [Calditrichaeota bacterium]|nr:MAG: GAF domain-containing protein [Calditrichota bacterium]